MAASAACRAIRGLSAWKERVEGSVGRRGEEEKAGTHRPRCPRRSATAVGMRASAGQPGSPADLCTNHRLTIPEPRCQPSHTARAIFPPTASRANNLTRHQRGRGCGRIPNSQLGGDGSSAHCFMVGRDDKQAQAAARCGRLGARVCPCVGRPEPRDTSKGWHARPRAALFARPADGARHEAVPLHRRREYRLDLG